MSQDQRGCRQVLFEGGLVILAIFLSLFTLVALGLRGEDPGAPSAPSEPLTAADDDPSVRARLERALEDAPR